MDELLLRELTPAVIGVLVRQISCTIFKAGFAGVLRCGLTSRRLQLASANLHAAGAMW
jgi:hypothetical protein